MVCKEILYPVMLCKATFLIECHCIIVLGIYSQLHIRAAEGLCQGSCLCHYLLADAVSSAQFLYAKLIHHHDLSSDDSRPIVIADFQEDIYG